MGWTEEKGEKFMELNTKYEWLEERTILLAPTGSFAYGTNTENSDKDYLGVTIPPKEYYLGLKSFDGYSNHNGQNFKNTKDDKDITVFHLNKFIKNLLVASPTMIEMLFIESDQYLKVTELGQQLLDNKYLFLTKEVKNSFGGYAIRHRKQMFKSTNKESLEKYGYDTKKAMHSVRSYQSALEILSSGDYSTYRPNNEFLLSILHGEFTKEQMENYLDVLELSLQDAYKESKLPEKVDYEKVNHLLINLNEQGFNL